MTVALVLSCSSLKRVGPAPALELYDGPRWRTLRTALRYVSPAPPIFAFSAQHGIIPSDTVISAYDNKTYVTSGQVDALHKFDELYCSMGKEYYHRLYQILDDKSWLGQFHWEQSPGLGYQQAELWRFLIKYELGVIR